jgi:two-component system, cell cycle response regulator DivK
MGLEESQACSQQGALSNSRANPVGGQAGQRQEPFRPPFVGQRRSKRSKPKRLRVGWNVVCLGAQHRLLRQIREFGGYSLAKILVVEDNALNIKLFCDLLTAHGHQTEPVTDSRDALEAARAFHPDLVITDIQLPYITGIELMELLRADEELKDVPIMAVTAYAAVGDDERIRAAGAQAYVSKPISVMRFAETVDQLLEAGRLVEGSSHSNQ